ncbi:MAG TPA: hypothetical protein VN381_17130 [Anaerovoracaceae bacterium]|nr:hypothetical protein [Anaerovoracaceae bacterium]
MRIESSNLNLQGSSQIRSVSSIEESLNFWIGQGDLNTAAAVDIQDFSQQAVKVSSSLSSQISQTGAEEAGLPASEEELKLSLIELMLTRLTGKKVKLQVPRVKLVSGGYNNSGQALGNLKLVSFSGDRQIGTGFGLIYNRSEIQIERSRVSFSAEGVVKTADGREISLNLNFNIDQEIVRYSSFELRAGDALKDPLVINFGGSVASFRDRTMTFDIDFDGDRDTLQMLNANSGYLALDLNGNGAVDDGRELFGPKTDHGYAELAEYDEDGNGWIDENDSIFNHLKIWYHDEQGVSRLAALTDKNVGAIYLGSVDTKMNMYSSAGMAGALRESGLVLLENGESRIMQELDVRV